VRVQLFFERATQAFEVLGVSSMVVGFLFAFGLAVVTWKRTGDGGRAFKTLRDSLGGAILLGLELLVAADIVKTVTSTPSLTDAAVLGMIVLIRTVLSITIEIEVDGVAPWRTRRYWHELRASLRGQRPTPARNSCNLPRFLQHGCGSALNRDPGVEIGAFARPLWVSGDNQTRSQPIRCDLCARGEVVDQRFGVLDQSGGVDRMRRRRVVVGNTSGRAAQQGDRTLEVAALDVSDADGQLGEALPQLPFLVRAVLPCGLKHLVRVEC
jgi:uncharacterized membrane protein